MDIPMCNCAIVSGIILFKLGVLTVLVAVLELSLKAAIGVIAGIGLLMIWIQHRKPYHPT